MYDLIIIGGGPVRLSAGLYGVRAWIKTLIIEKEIAGGQMGKTLDVENCPGVPNGHTEIQLAMRMEEQARSFGAEVKHETVEPMDLKSNPKKIKMDRGEYQAASIIITTGADPRKLNVPGEEKFASWEVSYCTTCDEALYEGVSVFVIGGGGAVVEETHSLTKFTNKVYLVRRRDQLRVAKPLQEKILNNKKVEIPWDSVLKEIKGEGMVQEVLIENVKTKEAESFRSSTDYKRVGIFTHVGYVPLTDFLKDRSDLVDGYIPTDEEIQAEIPGVYVAGDIRYEGFKQVVIAVGEGATIVMVARKYSDDLEP